MATSVLVGKATFKASEILEETKKEKGGKLETMEAVKLVAPVYIPSIVMGASTIACILGATYTCNHPVYNKCTLYLIDGKGLAVIQQRCDDEKRTWWDEIDPWLTNELYLHPRFKKFFDTRAEKHDEGLYPTVTIRQIMWALRMKPLKRERWETCFDKKDI